MLNKIVAHKKTELSRRKDIVPLNFIEDILTGFLPPRPLARALRRPGQVAVIAEVKKASPSKGILCKDFNPVRMAGEYERGGAAAISVLTEEKFFLGHHSHLSLVKKATVLPVLRKDFIIDPYQIYESRALGADAVLLIAAILPGKQMEELMSLAGELGMATLVEIHTEQELEHALSAGAGLIGINNRDLKTFAIDLKKTFELSGLIDKQNVTVVSESGITSRADILRLKDKGVHAALVGEALVCHVCPGEGLRELTGSWGREGACKCRHPAR
jgi:indole-3-glycerol phosphate synthase